MTGIRGRSVSAMLIGFALAAAACSAGAEPVVGAQDDAGEGSPTTEAATTSLTQAPTTEAPPTAPTTGAITTLPTSSSIEGQAETTVPPPCPNGANLSDQPASSIDADVDGDGLADVVVTEKRNDVWFVAVTFGRGGSADLGLFDADPFANVQVLGGIDFSADGSAEVALSIGGGAYTQSVAFVRARGCQLLRLAFEDSSPAAFLSGASIANVVGVVCVVAGPGPARVEQYEFVLIDGAADPLLYESVYRPYTIEGDFFVRQDGEGTVLSAEEVAAVGLFDCGGLGL